MPSAQTIKLFAIFAVILFGGLWLLLEVELPGDTRAVYELQNAGHVLIFSLITFSLIYALHRYWFKTSLWPPIICALSFGLFFGGATEFIQPNFGRDSSWDDLYKDIQGSAAGLFFYIAFNFSNWKRYFFAVVASAIVIFGLSSPFAMFYAKQKRDAKFPMLGDFESAIESRYFEKSYSGVFTRVLAPKEWSSNHSTVARVEFHPGSWPGLQAFDLRGNWGKYQNLKFSVFNPQNENLNLVVRIHDASHNQEHSDRFNQTFAIKPGEHEISIPIEKIKTTRSGREMKMGKIRVLMLYMSKPEKEYVLYFDDFRLE